MIVALPAGLAPQVEAASKATACALSFGSGMVWPSGMTLSSMTAPLLSVRSWGMVKLAPPREKVAPGAVAVPGVIPAASIVCRERLPLPPSKLGPAVVVLSLMMP